MRSKARLLILTEPLQEDEKNRAQGEENVLHMVILAAYGASRGNYHHRQSDVVRISTTLT